MSEQEIVKEILKCTFVCSFVGLAYMRKFLKIYIDIHSQDKSGNKNDIFDVVTSCSTFDNYIISENIF